MPEPERTEAQLKELDYRLKRSDFMLKAWEAMIDKALRVMTIGLAGNIGALVFLQTASRNATNKSLISDFSTPVGYWFLGAVCAVFGLSIAWTVSFIVHRYFIYLSANDLDHDLAKKSWMHFDKISQFASAADTLFMACATGTGVFFLWGMFFVVQHRHQLFS